MSERKRGRLKGKGIWKFLDHMDEKREIADTIRAKFRESANLNSENFERVARLFLQDYYWDEVCSVLWKMVEEHIALISARAREKSGGAWYVKGRKKACYRRCVTCLGGTPFVDELHYPELEKGSEEMGWEDMGKHEERQFLTSLELLTNQIEYHFMLKELLAYCINTHNRMRLLLDKLGLLKLG